MVLFFIEDSSLRRMHIYISFDLFNSAYIYINKPPVTIVNYSSEITLVNCHEQITPPCTNLKMLAAFSDFMRNEYKYLPSCVYI